MDDGWTDQIIHQSIMCATRRNKEEWARGRKGGKEERRKK